MANRGWSKSRYEAVRDYAAQHGRKATAAHFGISPSTVKRELSRGRKERGDETTLPRVSNGTNGSNEPKGPDTSQPGPGEQVVELPYLTSVDQMLEACDVDPEFWEVERQVVNKWDVTANIKGVLTTKQNLQLKAFLKHKYGGIDFDELRKVLERLPTCDPGSPEPLEQRAPGTGKHLLEVNIPDLHYGELCWAGESGEHYDSRIAEKRFLSAVDRLLSLSVGFGVGRIHFPVGSDYFNTDTPAQTTTAGTPQHNDGRWQKMYADGVGLLITAINRLRQVAPVQVILVQGNHDYQLAYCAAHAIDMHFRNVDGVTVDWRPLERKYYTFGKNLVCYTHGKSANGRAIPIKQWLRIITSEASKEWSNAEFREIHCGHTHHQETMEDGPIVIRHLGSLAGQNSYEYSSGWVGSRKVAHAFVWDAKQGPLAHLNYHVV
jgi:hypothetical protein